jgi:hypothetical protein
MTPLPHAHSHNDYWWDTSVDRIGTDLPYALGDSMWGKLKATPR